jgi:formylglycine-generating enzyme required for sulfatase activity
MPTQDLEWREVKGGEYEIGLREDEARAFASLAAQQARDKAAADPDQLHPKREEQRLAQMWGNPDYLYAQLAHSMPAHRVTLPPFEITTTPVRIVDFAIFRRATGAPAPATYATPREVEHAQPVTGLSWTEAAAYAKWIGAELVAEAMWEAALRPSTRSPFGEIDHDFYEWCADEFGPYPGADLVACERIAPPPDGWQGTRTRRGVIPGFPRNVVGRRGGTPALRLRDTTFRLMRR